MNVLIWKGRPRNNDLWNSFSLDLGVQMRDIWTGAALGHKTPLWQKKSTGSATLKKFSLFVFGFSLFALETGCLFFAFRFWISAFGFSISDYVTVVFFSILVFDFRLFNFKKNSELSSQFLISIIQFVTFYKYLFTWVYSVSFAKITHPVD